MDRKDALRQIAYIRIKERVEEYLGERIREEDIHKYAGGKIYLTKDGTKECIGEVSGKTIQERKKANFETRMICARLLREAEVRRDEKN